MFANREEGGTLLAKKLEQYKNKDNILVLGVPRGGVVTAKIISDNLSCPLDIIVVKKMTQADNPELAIGAVGPGNTVYWDEELCRKLEVKKSQRSDIKHQKLKELLEREKLLRNNKTYPNFIKKNIIIVDDGVATGATAIAASKFSKKMGAQKIILATPVIAKDTFKDIKRYFDEVVFVENPQDFYAVGEFYKDFPQITDEEAKLLLN